MVILKPLKNQFLGLQIPINNILLAFITIYIFIICILAYWIDPVFPWVAHLQVPAVFRPLAYCVSVCCGPLACLPFHSTERFEIHLLETGHPAPFDSVHSRCLIGGENHCAFCCPLPESPLNPHQTSSRCTASYGSAPGWPCSPSSSHMPTGRLMLSSTWSALCVPIRDVLSPFFSGFRDFAILQPLKLSFLWQVNSFILTIMSEYFI